MAARQSVPRVHMAFAKHTRRTEPLTDRFGSF
jgi:hypothetical protein